jgi:antitoxin ParD1/3/4
MATMNISLPDEMKAFVEAQVATGRFANASDYVRDLIRYARTERDLIDDALEEGENSGFSEMSPRALLEEIRGRAR